MNGLIYAILILGIIFVVIFIIVLIYLLVVLRNINKNNSKLSIILDDVTTKLDSLSPSVKAINKFLNYIDILNIFSNKSLKSILLLANRNKSILYKIFENLKKISGKKAKKYKSTILKK